MLDEIKFPEIDEDLDLEEFEDEIENHDEEINSDNY